MGHRINTFYTDPEKKGPSVGWNLASSLGQVSVVVALVGAALITTSGRFGIRDKVAHLVPHRLLELFQRETLIPAPPNLGERARDAINAVAPASDKSSGARRNVFAVGDSERTVLRIQGEPTSRSGSVWYYGGSQVTFLGGRVVSWNNSSTHPLNVQ